MTSRMVASPVLRRKPWYRVMWATPPFCARARNLVVGEVAGHVAECTATGMGADNRRAADVESVVERLLVGMAEIDHDAFVVHPLDDLGTEL